MPPLGDIIVQQPAGLTVLDDEAKDSSFRSTVSLGLNRKKNLSVQFDDNVTVHETMHRSDLAMEEFCSYWLSPREYAMIRDMISLTVNLMEHGDREDELKNICFRGLEGRTRQGRAWCDASRFDMMLAVMEEQDFQRCQGPDASDEAIASMCRQESKECKKMALARARTDRQSVEDYLRM